MDFVDVAGLLIRLGIGIVMVVFGLTQIKNPKPWLAYIPGLIRFLMPVAPTGFMRTHGMGNVSLGLLLMSGIWLPVSIWLVLAWWLWILPFAFYYEWTAGLRDFAIIMALIALIVLYP